MAVTGRSGSEGRRRICVVTGSRAEYGLLRWVMAGIRDSSDLSLQLIVTGGHLSADFGHTEVEILSDGFIPDRRIDMCLAADDPRALTESMGRALLGFGEALEALHPDIVILLGDRYETWCAAGAATMARIPIAHVHGGEVTHGALDDALRHAMTKMAHLHYVAAPEYAHRVAQLGEQPDRIHCVGAVGLDGLLHTRLLEPADLAADLGVTLGPRTLLVTFHPVTLLPGTALDHLTEVLAALDACRDADLVFTLANADPEGRAINMVIEQFCAGRPRAHLVGSLGQQRYLSLVRHAAAVVGNSSSGLIEAPAVGTPTVNIGSRQAGRLRASSVIDCEPERGAISSALTRAMDDPRFPRGDAIERAYLGPGASAAIVAHVAKVPLDGLLHKRFVDWPG